MNLLDLMIKVGIDDQASSGLDRIVSNVKNVASSIGSGLATAAKVGTAAVTVAAGGIAALTTAAVNSFADYEQLVGGVETLFKDAAGAVQSYADEAFRTAGLSANEYMETVTSFSASLLQSLDGDTAAAADAAQEAIVDMADNANKMGTSMALIQNAYQGFAKQNFSMLDNLKLGYGGTQAEMYRLMQTAAELDETFAKTAEFSLDAKGHLTAEFADITKAIHIVQTEMGITGTTAKEASTTISGSVASVKAAWSNMLRTIADDNADFGVSVGNLVDSVGTAFSNLLPRIETALVGVANFVGEVAPVIIEAIPQMIDTVLPSMLSALQSVATAAVDAVKEIGRKLLEGITNVFYEFTGIDLTPILVSLTEVANLIRDTLGGMLDGVDLESVASVVNGFLEKLAGAVSGVVAAVQGDTFKGFVQDIMEFFGSVTGALVSNLKPAAEGLKELFDNFRSAAPGVIQSVADAFGSFAGWFETSLAPAVGAVASAIVKLLEPFIDGLAPIISGIAEALSGVFSHANQGEATFMGQLADGVVQLLGIFTDAIGPIIKNVADAIVVFGDALQEKAPELFNFGDGLESIFGFFTGILENIGNVALEISYLILDLAELDGEFDKVFGDLGSVIGSAVYAIADAFDDLVSRVAQGFSDIAKLFAGSNFGQLMSFVDGTWFENLNEDINAFGERAWDLVTGGIDGYKKARNADVASDIADLRSGLPMGNIPIAGSGIGKVTEDAVNAVIAGAAQKVVVQPAPVILDGREVAEVVFDHADEVEDQRGEPAGG